MHNQGDAIFSEYPFNLIFMFEKSGDTNYPGRIVATPNGKYFYEIFRADFLGDDFADALLSRPRGPMPTDPNKYIYVDVYHRIFGNKVIRFKMPEWVKIN